MLQMNFLYFSEIGPQLAMKIQPTEVDPLGYLTPGTEAFEIQNIRKVELEKRLKSLKANKTSDLDQISNKLLIAAEILY